MYEEADDGTRHRRFADPVSVGDEVRVSIHGEIGVIEELLPRRSKFARLLPKPSDDAPDIEQIVVANVDQVVIVASVKQPRLNLRFVDRLLVLAEFGKTKPVLALNKTDLLNPKDRDELKALIARVYGPCDLETRFVSAERGDGIDGLKDGLKDRFSVFVGSSGVGKSSILNSLDPRLGAPVAEVSRSSSKGRHTTAHVQLHELGFGARIADTPGMREAGIWGVPTEMLDYHFVEMRPYLGQCKFSDCWHFEEPKCAVRRAVENGEISEERYLNYRRLCREAPVEEHERRPKRLR